MKLFSYSRKNHEGFTLLELLIVTIILGILSAVAVPTFIGQIGKARETEIKNTVGTINRAQQAYHWETRMFASAPTDSDSIKLLNLSIVSKYIDGLNIDADASSATVAPQNIDHELNQIKAYSGGTFTQAGVYSMTICQSPEPTDKISPPSSDNDCGSNILIN